MIINKWPFSFRFSFGRLENDSLVTEKEREKIEDRKMILSLER